MTICFGKPGKPQISKNNGKSPKNTLKLWKNGDFSQLCQFTRGLDPPNIPQKTMVKVPKNTLKTMGKKTHFFFNGTWRVQPPPRWDLLLPGPLSARHAVAHAAKVAPKGWGGAHKLVQLVHEANYIVHIYIYTYIYISHRIHVCHIW